MRRIFAGRSGAIMTTGTGAGDPGMVKPDIGPTSRNMTIVTGV